MGRALLRLNAVEKNLSLPLPGFWYVLPGPGASRLIANHPTLSPIFTSYSSVCPLLFSYGHSQLLDLVPALI